jgi:tetratricopeptide (TPR) repeat protein
LAAVFHKMSVVAEVLGHYSSRARLPLDDFPVFSLLVNTLRGDEPRGKAMMLYREAISFAPSLAEAHYGLARLAQADANTEAARAGFEKVLTLSPHVRAPSNAFLHANAHWERATILEDQGRDQEALRSYRAALTRLNVFGVHHVRFARFLRRLGRVDEAGAHYRRCMVYTHRYFPEFLPPALVAAALPPSPTIDLIYNTQRGEPVVFWNGAYFAIDGRSWSADLIDPRKFRRRLAAGLPHRTATSIAALEDEIH